MPYSYEYARPALTVDCVVFGLDADDLKLLLIQRDLEPYAGRWALPGGFVRVGESTDDAARRELAEETGLEKVFLEQLYTFGSPDRDPREHIVSVAHYALVRLSDIPRLAFDHQNILKTAHQRLRGKVRYQPIGFELLPARFPLRSLQHLYEVILERTLDKRNFRKKILSMDVLEELDEIETDVAHRAARLYRFDKRKYHRLVKEGFNFEV
jgi:8-oxo-dGTP diphosphatase